MEKQTEIVSVYLPTYNRVELLQRAVESVLSQTYQNIELLVVDDGSEDGTKEYLSRVSEYDSRIVQLEKTGERGAPASRNYAIFHAKGKYITGLDDDDFFLKDHIEKLVAEYEPRLSCVFPRKFNWKDLFFSPVCMCLRKVYFSQILYFNIIGNQVFTETFKLREIGGFNERLEAAQDYDTWIRLLKRFGAAKIVMAETYQVDVNHSGERISTNSVRKIQAYNQICKTNRLNKGMVSNSFKLRSEILMGRVSVKLLFVCLIDPRNYRHIFHWYKRKCAVFSRVL